MLRIALLPAPNVIYSRNVNGTWISAVGQKLILNNGNYELFMMTDPIFTDKANTGIPKVPKQRLSLSLAMESQGISLEALLPKKFAQRHKGTEGEKGEMQEGNLRPTGSVGNAGVFFTKPAVLFQVL
jgi:hypothetical protein